MAADCDAERYQLSSNDRYYANSLLKGSGAPTVHTSSFPLTLTKRGCEAAWEVNAAVRSDWVKVLTIVSRIEASPIYPEVLVTSSWHFVPETAQYLGRQPGPGAIQGGRCRCPSIRLHSFITVLFAQRIFRYCRLWYDTCTHQSLRMAAQFPVHTHPLTQHVMLYQPSTTTTNPPMPSRNTTACAISLAMSGTSTATSQAAPVKPTTRAATAPKPTRCR